MEMASASVASSCNSDSPDSDDEEYIDNTACSITESANDVQSSPSGESSNFSQSSYASESSLSSAEKIQNAHDPGSGDEASMVEAAAAADVADEVDHSDIAFLEAEIAGYAEEADLVKRPRIAARTTPRRREVVVPPRARLEIQELYSVLSAIRNGNLDDPNGIAEARIIQTIMDMDYVSAGHLASLSVRKSTIPCFTCAQEAFANLGHNHHTFKSMFGFSVVEVEHMANVLFLGAPRFRAERVQYQTEECLLVVLARLKLSVATLSAMQVLFKRASSSLAEIFRDASKYILDEHAFLIHWKHIDRFAPIVTDCKRVMLQKYRDVLKNPDADLPERFQGVGGILDGSKFEISRPNIANGADVQRSYYNGKGAAHYINSLMVILPNGIRACAIHMTGRHADPYVLTDEVRAMFALIDLPLLGDAIFGYSAHIRGLEKPSESTIAPEASVGLAGIRIAVEWGFAEIKNHYPLLATPCKLKLFQTRPLGLIELGVLFANFRTCMRGENTTSYFNLLPPTLESYVHDFGVRPRLSSRQPGVSAGTEQ
jgi:hypothetical protein